MRAELQTARELGEQLLSLAQSIKTRSPCGGPPCTGGHLVPAWRAGLCSDALGAGDCPVRSPAAPLPGFRFGRTLGWLASLCWPGLWLLGYPDQALKRSQEALTLAQECLTPLAWLMRLLCCLVSISSAERSASQEQTEALITSRREQGFPHGWRMGAHLRGWALAEQGQGEEGIAQMRQGWLPRATGAELSQPYFLALLAEAYGKVGQEKKG